MAIRRKNIKMPDSKTALIFTDIDGVLNRWTGRPSPVLIEPACMANLNAILDAVPAAKIVVTSSLRMLVHSGEMTIHGLEYLLRSHGMRGSLAEDGITAADDEGDGLDCRGRQIRKWIQKHSFLASQRQFIILDDEDDGIVDRFGDSFVHVNGGEGLTADRTKFAIRLLAAKLDLSAAGS